MVIVVLAIIGSMAAPSFSSFLGRSGTFGIESDFVNTLSFARSEAMRRGLPVAVTATAPVARSLTRLTVGSGLQNGPSWSPDGRFIAYSSDRGGTFAIWVQPVGGGDPIQVTHSPWLMAITILDIAVIAMTWHEYRFLRRRMRTTS